MCIPLCLKVSCLLVLLVSHGTPMCHGTHTLRAFIHMIYPSHTYEYIPLCLKVSCLFVPLVSHGTPMCHGTHVYIHTYDTYISQIWMSHVTHTNESCLTYESVMSQIRMCHITHITFDCVMSNVRVSHGTIWVSHITRVNKSCHTCECVACGYVSESCHTFDCVISLRHD